jgi:hypothetical protein
MWPNSLDIVLLQPNDPFFHKYYSTCITKSYTAPRGSLGTWNKHSVSFPGFFFFTHIIKLYMKKNIKTHSEGCKDKILRLSRKT